jgi:phosphocarrier protein
VTEVEVVIGNPLGLHARAAARFVSVAGQFASQIRVGRRGRFVDGKSILGLLSLAAARGVTLVITADGSDEVVAAGALRALVEQGFDAP